MFQVVDPVGYVALAGELFAFAQQRGPAAGRLADGGALAVVAGEGIEQVQLAVACQQGLVLVLAVDFHQPAGQFGQLRQRHAAAVDPGARAAIGADHPAQLALAVVVQFVVGQPGLRGRSGGGGELGGQFGAFGAVAHHGTVGAQAGQEAQGVHQQ